MKTLTIKDLTRSLELDRSAMSAVRGGMGTSKVSAASPYPHMPSFSAPMFGFTQSDFSFNASQSLGQSQNTLVNNGNNVAFADNITANVTPHQSGSNNINFGH
ncbi:hypothetical protein [Noviherbaspirillum autotrophicum]|uniref:Uncharacterized protein n=1 Tax=Noviherbaspirillum autotrophicum TaxID=709839 RepID=A0A0C1Y1T9_9BURK|nr:hypothetical protein [Noviherbaspirillum autotrophicum]KIF81008.1 hypothetical protein TSA66_09590 [Noviherbaspirillum autotrophicum]